MSTHAAKIQALNVEHVATTKNPMSLEQRRETIAVLSQLVADLTDVALAARQAAWNVRGPDYPTLNEKFNAIFHSIDTQAERLAHRAAALGGVAPATVQAVNVKSRMDSFPATTIAPATLVEMLGDRFGLLAKYLSDPMTGEQRLQDPVTLNLLTDALTVVEEKLWSLERYGPIAA